MVKAKLGEGKRAVVWEIPAASDLQTIDQGHVSACCLFFTAASATVIAALFRSVSECWVLGPSQLQNRALRDAIQFAARSVLMAISVSPDQEMR